jgi:flagellar P-ring protein precursor FlgI
MKKIFLTILLSGLAFPGLFAETKVSDITKISGLDDNIIRGVGLVAGLNGKGDKGKAVKRAVKIMHEKIGFAHYEEKDIEARNMAIVILTAKIPPFARAGQKIDIDVAAQGAESLEGGTLVDSFLYLAGFTSDTKDKLARAIVVAQGKVLIGNNGQVGLTAGGGNASASQPTSGVVKDGGIVIQELPSTYIKSVKNIKGEVVSKYFSLLLDRASFENAKIVADAINADFVTDMRIKGENSKDVKYAEAISANEIRVKIPKDYSSEEVEFIARVEKTRLLAIASEASVRVNEKTGNITVSGQVLLNECTIAYQGIIINIAKDSDLSQVLQALGINFNTKDQITILKQIHSAGHLRAKFVAE